MRALVLLVVLASTRAYAQNAAAESLFAEADKLLRDGKVSDACDAFAASNTLEPRAGTLIRLADCRERNHQLASAWSAYKEALGRVKDPVKRQIATAKVAELEPRLSKLTIVADRADLTITRNDKPYDRALWNRAVPLDGGKYEI